LDHDREELVAYSRPQRASINDARTGQFSLVEHVATQGRTPRNFAFDPSRRWIIVTNHGSDNAMVFRVDGGTGRLTPRGRPVDIGYPFGT